MGYNWGNFYLEKRDLFLFLALLLLVFCFYFKIPLPYFSYPNLFLFALLFLLTKGLLLPAHDPLVFLAFFAALILTLFLPLLQVLLFLFLVFFFLRLLKIV